MASVSIQNLDIRLGGVEIIGKLNLEVKDGEFLVLLGPSGCGKSTLLHSIAGLIDAYDGTIDIGGKDVTWADPKDRGIGMVFQSYALYPTMTVEKNMSFGPSVNGMPKDEISRRVTQAAKMLHLTDLLQRKPANLSGGQRQRVAIGRALVRNADVFLFDEPLSNLDAKLRAELRRELKQLYADLGSTMIYVTHDQVEAMTLATRIAVMRAGKIQQLDAPTEVYSHPANIYVAGFLGSPSMNLMQGTLDIADSTIYFVAPQMRVNVSAYPFIDQPIHGTAVVLGIRPEDMSLQCSATSESVCMQVRWAEPMGPNQVLWLKLQELTLSMNIDSAQQVTSGSDVFIAFNTSRISLFSRDTENRL